MLDLNIIEILNWIFFLMPGYLVLYFINIFTDYLNEKDSIEKIIQYLLFSAVSYTISIIIIGIISIEDILLFKKDFIYFFNFYSKSLFLPTIAIIFSPILGAYLGENYFGKGYPNKHFKTTKDNSPSIFSKFLRDDYKKGALIACHMKDGSIITGSLCNQDFDEDKRDYVLVLTNAKQFFDKGKTQRNLHGKNIVINSKDCYLIEFHD